ncbi:serine/threonine-protein kinase SBK1 isoform X2 [Thrips palmi]|uniref:Serine/threonine-protein kinase SBK1 isoform X2 n=1 Tax=Thrips palmi TaxID=161013 RepID=A0A6P8ZY26_THRPL|nr:serine/threonine-protein kinase SBK1 isoform X2 [Thrips palmi]
MGSSGKKAIGGSIHRIREFELEKVNLAEEFDILQIVGEGWFGKILLAEHRATGREAVLKALPKPYTALKDFYREFHYSLHLGAHRSIITTQDVAFETAGFYVFTQEYAPLGDLTANVSDNGIGDLHSKRVAKQVASALEHLHSRDLVHRDVKLDNVLVLRSDFSRVKLCDFGETRRAGTLVTRRHEWLPYSPPEVLLTDTDQTYKAETSHDVWQFAVVVFVCLTGCLPWQKAAPDDPRYARYVSWRAAASMPFLPASRRPKLWRLISARAQRMLRNFLEPRADRRPASLGELQRYLDDRWVAKGSGDKKEEGVEDDGLCPSMYSFHSSVEEKNKLLATLSECGIETTVDRGAKKDRIHQWVQSSVIAEDDEEGESEDGDLEGESWEEEESQPRPRPRTGRGQGDVEQATTSSASSAGPVAQPQPPPRSAASGTSRVSSVSFADSQPGPGPQRPTAATRSNGTPKSGPSRSGTHSSGRTANANPKDSPYSSGRVPNGVAKPSNGNPKDDPYAAATAATARTPNGLPSGSGKGRTAPAGRATNGKMVNGRTAREPQPQPPPQQQQQPHTASGESGSRSGSH